MSLIKLERGDDEFDRAWYLHIGENTFAHIENDWPQLWGKYNWKTYRIADIYYEDDVMLGGHEFRFVLFGFGFRIRHNNPDNEKMKELENTAKELSKKSARTN